MHNLFNIHRHHTHIWTHNSTNLNTDYVKNNAAVIEVGISRVDGEIKGDVDMNSVKERASYITPVPGGVGPMTIAMLLSNVVESAKNSLKEGK